MAGRKWVQECGLKGVMSFGLRASGHKFLSGTSPETLASVPLLYLKLFPCFDDDDNGSNDDSLA